MKLNTKKTFCIFASVILYCLSLFFPAVVMPEFSSGYPGTSPGYVLLFVGWLGVMVFQPGWIANLFYIAALLTYGSKISYRFSMVALIIALFSPFIYVNQVLIGFYIWLASIMILLYGNTLHEFSPD